MSTTIKSFFELDCWKYAHKFVLAIYAITKKFPGDERFGVVSQLRRAAASITANIAEGFDRFHYKDQIKFYYQSRGSLAETQNFLVLSKDLAYIEQGELTDLLEETIVIYKLLNGFIRAVEHQAGKA